MADEVQNIRIKFITDTTDLKEAGNDLDKITAEEREAVNAFNKFNQAAKTQEGILERLAKDEKILLQSRQKSNDPKAIQMYNKQIESTRAQIKSLTSESQKGASVLSGLGSSLLAAFSIGAVVNFTSKVISITSEFQKLEAVLTNTLGSQSGAKRALADIQKFASVTNFGVLELTNGFVKLANSGFQPSKENLRQLADLANSTGKSFDQLVEAVLDANTFQFERLKEFGIKASQEGDKIKFTFKGVTTEVDKTASSVQNYLLSLGDLQGVTGSTAAISETLGGQLSNLDDNFDALFNALGTANKGVLADTIGAFNALIGTIGGYLAASNQIEDALKGGGISDEFIISVNKGNLAVQSYFETLNNAIDKAGDYDSQLKLINNELDRQAGFYNEGSINIEEFNVRQALLRNAYKETAQAYQDNQKKISDEAEKAAIAEEEKAKKAAAAQKKIRDQRFKEELDDLKRREDIARRENTLTGGGDEQDLQIQDSFQQQRLNIIKKYIGAQNLTYEDANLRLREIEREQSNFLLEEEKKRAEEREAFLKSKADDDLRVLEDTGKRRVVQNEQQSERDIDQLRRQFINRSITFKQYQEQEAQLKHQAARQDLEDLIIVDREKLNVENISAEQRFTIEKDLFDKEKQLRDLDFEEFSKNEDKKAQKAKEAAELRSEIAQTSFDVGVSIINSLSEISQNQTQAEINDLKVKQERELDLAGENKQKQAQINERYARQQQALQLKLAKQQRSNAIFNATISAGESIVKTLASTPYPANIALAALAGVAAYAQVRAIESAPLPVQYFKGTEFVPLNGNPRGRDTIPAMLHEGERVVPADINKQLKGIPNADLPSLLDLYNSRIDYEGISRRTSASPESAAISVELIKAVNRVGKKIDNMQKIDISIDKYGINTLITKNQSKTEFTNNYFRV